MVGDGVGYLSAILLFRPQAPPVNANTQNTVWYRIQRCSNLSQLPPSMRERDFTQLRLTAFSLLPQTGRGPRRAAQLLKAALYWGQVERPHLPSRPQTGQAKPVSRPMQRRSGRG
jgi:hypothetical protein